VNRRNGAGAVALKAKRVMSALGSTQGRGERGRRLLSSRGRAEVSMERGIITCILTVQESIPRKMWLVMFFQNVDKGSATIKIYQTWGNERGRV